jgi:hypothetical protein
MTLKTIINEIDIKMKIFFRMISTNKTYIFILIMLVNMLNLQATSTGDVYTHQFPSFHWDEHFLFDEKLHSEYIIQISRDKKFKNIIDCDTIAINRYVSSEPLPYGSLYWRTALKSNTTKELDWSKVRSVKICPPDITIKVKNDNLKQSLKKAQELTKQNKIVCLDFIENEYYLAPSEKCFVELKNTNNLILKGNGAIIMLLSANQSFCLIEECNNITISGFTVDYPKEMTFLQGKIIDSNTNSGYIDVTVEPGFPTYDDKYFIENDEAPIMLLDPNINGRLKNQVPDYYQIDMKNIKKLGGRSYRLFFKNVTISVEGNKNYLHSAITNNIAKHFTVGDRYVHTTRSNKAGFIGYIKGGSSVTFYDITNHGVGHFHYAGYLCSDMKFLKVNALMKDKWWWQGNADGIHLRSNRIGPWIENVFFEGIGDDAIALYARPMTIKSIWPNGNKKTLELNSEHFYLSSGDEVSFFNPRDGKIILETTVKTVNQQLIEFYDDIPDDLVTKGIIQEVDQIWNRSASCGDFVVRNSTFRGVRRFGTVFRAKRGLIERCNYESCSTAAIVFTNETQYPNGLYCSNIIIRNNVIKDCGFANTSAAAIFMKFNRLKQLSNNSLNDFFNHTESYGPQNIYIYRNNFYQLYSKKIIEFKGVKNAVISDNKYERKELVEGENVVINNSNNINVK